MKVIPFKDTILVKRRKVGETLEGGKTKGGIVLPDTTQEKFIDIADVLEVPDLTFADKAIIDNAEEIIRSLVSKASNGDGKALRSLQEINDFIKRKSIKVGDTVFLSRYVGTDFNATGETETQTIVKIEDIIGVVI